MSTSNARITRRHRALHVGPVVWVAIHAAAPAAAQQICRGPDSTSALLVQEMERYVFATDGDEAIVRDSLRMRANPRAMDLVRDEPLCARAAQAYRHELDRNLDTVSGQVIVLRAADRYIIWDPGYQYDLNLPFAPWFVVITDSEFRRLSLF